MASTKLQRKARRNRVVAKKRMDSIQRLNEKPVIKNVDVEKIKEEFSKGKVNKPVDFDEPLQTQAYETKQKLKEIAGEKPETKKAEPKAKKETTAAPKKEAKAEAKKEEAPKKEENEASDGFDQDALFKSVGKAEASDKDDLKKITGIGPAYEKKLNEIGLYTYEQISKLKKADLENLANVDGIGTDKIESDDWVGAAKELMKDKK